MSCITSFRQETEAALKRLPSLKLKYPETAQILDFYARALEFRRDTADAVNLSPGAKDAIVWRENIPRLRNLLQLCSQAPSKDLAEEAQRLKAVTDESLVQLVASFLASKTALETSRFIFIVFLGGIYTSLADASMYNPWTWLQRECPVCGFPPTVSFLWDKDDTEGARFLRCGICQAGWHYNRASCAACGCNDDHQLVYFQSEDDRALTIQACNACRNYIKMIDTRVIGEITPELDDVASLSLDLWAREQGYRKNNPNLFGV